jgi:RHS repeat-associated protein
MADDLTTATVASASDYYPFGLQMDSRTVNDGDYRYGFNGKEKDQDGEFGNTHYDYGFRIYNPAIAKFLSVDPLTDEYPWYTPYQFAGNKPIIAIDIEGAEPEYVINKEGKLTKPFIALISSAYGFDNSLLEKSTWVSVEGLMKKESVYARTSVFHPNKVEYDPFYGEMHTLDQIAFNKYKNQGKKYHRTDDPWYDEFYTWGELISHEEAHRNDYSILGFWTSFTTPVGTMEDRARHYGRGSEAYIDVNSPMSKSMAGKLLGNNKIPYSILKDTKMDVNEKVDRLTLFGLEFRLNYLKENEALPYEFSKKERENYKNNRSKAISELQNKVELYREKVSTYEK